MTDRELDALVSEKVLGWEIEQRWCNWCPDGGGLMENPFQDDKDFEPNLTGTFRDEMHPCEVRRRGEYPWLNPVPFFSTSIDAAWKLLEKFKDREFSLNYLPPDGESHSWMVGFDRPVCAKTAARAICFAALQVVGAEADDDG